MFTTEAGNSKLPGAVGGIALPIEAFLPKVRRSPPTDAGNFNLPSCLDHIAPSTQQLADAPLTLAGLPYCRTHVQGRLDANWSSTLEGIADAGGTGFTAPTQTPFSTARMACTSSCPSWPALLN